jgi:phosphoglycerate kinase
MPNITFIDDVEIINKRVLIRNDFNVSLNQSHKIANDQRIRQAIPTISYLLKNQNKLILTSHLGEPKGYDSSLSLRVIQEDLERFLPDYTIILFPTIQTLKDGYAHSKINRRKIAAKFITEIETFSRLTFGNRSYK